MRPLSLILMILLGFFMFFLAGLAGLVFYLVIMFIVIAIRKARKKEIPPTPQPPAIIKEREVIKEIVMIPCTYCGTLMPQAATSCPNCGATRRR